MVIRKSRSSTTKGRRERVETKYTPPHFDREERIKYHGVQACLTLFECRRGDIRRVFVTPERKLAFANILEWAERRGVPHKVVPYEELSRVVASEHHEGVCLEAVPLKVLSASEFVRKVGELQRGAILLLEAVENPHNIGAILRTACFFGIHGVVVVSRSLSDLSGAACRVAEGAAERLPIAFVKEYGVIATALKKRGFAFFATTPHEARSLYGVRWPNKYVVVFGAEGTGLSREALESADTRVVIPRLGPLESLNVSSAVASVLTEARREAVVKGQIRMIGAVKSSGQTGSVA